MVSYHVEQGDNKSYQLTFMLPSRLARSMTRNFLMRSLGKKKKRAKETSQWIKHCMLLKSTASGGKKKKKKTVPFSTVKMTDVLARG